MDNEDSEHENDEDTNQSKLNNSFRIKVEYEISVLFPSCMLYGSDCVCSVCLYVNEVSKNLLLCADNCLFHLRFNSAGQG